MTEEKRQVLLQRAQQSAGTLTAATTKPAAGFDLIVQIVPDNPVKAAANGDMLGVMFFALFLGIGLSLTKTEAARQLQDALAGLYDVSMRLIGIVIQLAPYAVAALLFNLTATDRLRCADASSRATSASSFWPWRFTSSSSTARSSSSWAA